MKKKVMARKDKEWIKSGRNDRENRNAKESYKAIPYMQRNAVQTTQLSIVNTAKGWE